MPMSTRPGHPSSRHPLSQLDQPVPPSLGTETNLSSLLDRASWESNTPTLETSPTVSYSTTPSLGRQQYLGLPFQQPQKSLAANPRPQKSQQALLHIIRLILDEVQTGLGQKGKLQVPLMMMIQERAIGKYFCSFSSAQLSKASEVFGWPMNELKQRLVLSICSGHLPAKLELDNAILRAHQPTPRSCLLANIT
ncbi:hypothetical protein PTTG_26713 [Puccinia triticina 1-1 BBBD Race 1]|uniref:Uncharacterized protein n=2 Tax=Puccinia triticina TaxID=208348 RepID=A0A180GR67_PUCT1|nr:uncharacterized protein PtA15_3A508 [Puccinia triticina]OAV95316.1 hypothetical protein PTTG_26713 [Puccinia triticina 1-1 BBBD Race 1]WAQ83141.1 hypothetical protein PtA15_3A508 [Puccinia triticina]WAR53981.1 hypothetical protein PtB15_3B491 [Puccinia triticina]